MLLRGFILEGPVPVPDQGALVCADYDAKGLQWQWDKMGLDRFRPDMQRMQPRLGTMLRGYRQVGVTSQFWDLFFFLRSSM